MKNKENDLTFTNFHEGIHSLKFSYLMPLHFGHLILQLCFDGKMVDITSNLERALLLDNNFFSTEQAGHKKAVLNFPIFCKSLAFWKRNFLDHNVHHKQCNHFWYETIELVKLVEQKLKIRSFFIQLQNWENSNSPDKIRMFVLMLKYGIPFYRFPSFIIIDQITSIKEL